VSDVATSKLVEIYIKMRDKRAEITREFEAKDAGIKQQMQLVQSKLLEACKDADADSIKTGQGTVIRTTKTRYWTSDWSSMMDFIRENDAFELMEQRLHQTRVKEFITANPDKLPPGLNSEREYSISVRKAK
jgi:phage host-nuclease inhibitor protein Gam